jgi:hypothetical protein
MKKLLFLIPLAILTMGATEGCDRPPSSDQIQQAHQERILQEGTSSVGMPAIKNFRERRILKDILELRDQEGLVTYTYVWNEMQGKMVFLCDSIGYGIPYATQFTNPDKVVYPYTTGAGALTIPQADPNGLFSPASAEGTWVLCKNPRGKDVRPVYIEPRTIVSPFPFHQ